jgi:putative PIN family toxin of toxin-antitoxin system
MRIVADTNVIVSGFLWSGIERLLLDAARDGIVELFVTPKMLRDLDIVLSRRKFNTRLRLKSVSKGYLLREYSVLATMVEPTEVIDGVSRDPDDDEILSCATSAACESIVTGDLDLLVLKEFRGIKIVRTRELLAELKLV